MRTTRTKLLALGTAAALGLAACGGGDEEAAPAVSGEARPVQQEPAAPEGEQATADGTEEQEVEARVDDAASTLRAELTVLLQEHVHLTGLAVDAVIEDGQDSPSAQGAIQALDASSTALGDLVAALPGVDDPEEFRQAWQEHVAAYVDYAAARAEEDDEAAAEATATLEDLLQPMADFFEEISDEEILADELFGELETHVTMVTDAIDAMVAGDAEASEDEEAPEASDLLNDAALHMDAVAADLAAGVVAAHPEELPGDPLSVPAETRASLVSGLVEHTYLTLLAAGEAADADGASDDPAVQAAATTLDGSADDLATAASGVGGNDGRDDFLDLWRPFLTATTDYAAAVAAGDTAAADAARATLAGTTAPLTQVLTASAGGNAPGDLEAQLSTHVANLTGAIDALVADDPAAYTQARAAAQHAASVASALAGAIVAAQPPAVEDGAGEAGTSGGEDAEGLNTDPATAAPDQAAEDTAVTGSGG